MFGRIINGLHSQLFNYSVHKTQCPTCDACTAEIRKRGAGASTALSLHSQIVLSMVTEVGESLITTG